MFPYYRTAGRKGASLDKAMQLIKRARTEFAGFATDRLVMLQQPQVITVRHSGRVVPNHAHTVHASEAGLETSHAKHKNKIPCGNK